MSDFLLHADRREPDEADPVGLQPIPISEASDRTVLKQKLHKSSASTSKLKIKLRVDEVSRDMLIHVSAEDSSDEKSVGSNSESELESGVEESANETDSSERSVASSSSSGFRSLDSDDMRCASKEIHASPIPSTSSVDQRDHRKRNRKRPSQRSRCLHTSKVNIAERMERTVNQLQKSWIGGTSWLEDGLMQTCSLYAELRSDIRKYRNEWSSSEYFERLGYFFFNLACDLQTLQTTITGKTFNLSSIEKALETSMSSLAAISYNDEECVERVKALMADTESHLKEISSFSSTLKERCGLGEEYWDKYPEKYVQLSILLGRVMDQPYLNQEIAKCSAEIKPDLQKQVQSIQLLQAVILLEDALTVPTEESLINRACHSLLLSRALKLASSPSLDVLSRRYAKTGNSLVAKVMSGQSSCGSQSEIQDKLDGIIRKYVENYEEVLSNVKIAIEDYFEFDLSSTDVAYVESKYVGICSQLWLKQVSIFLKKNLEEKNLDLVFRLFRVLDDISRIESVGNPFNELKYYHLLKDHSRILSRDAEKIVIRELKERTFSSLSLYTSWVRREFDFIETFSGFLCSFKNAPVIISKLELSYFCAGSVGLPRVLENISKLNPQVEGARVVELKASVESLGDAQDFFLLDKLREVLETCIQLPEVKQPITKDGRLVVEVLGANMAVSSILAQVETILKEWKNPSIEEIRFISSKVIHLDENLEGKIWQGRNVVVWTEKVVVYDRITWNVSGSHNEHQFESPAGTAPDGQGERGTDGYPGKSGGNVLVLASVIENPTNWTIISKGGDGSNGQEGGGGKDGKDGMGITESDLEKRFPSATKHFRPLADANLETILSSIRVKGIESSYIWKEPDKSIFFPNLDCHIHVKTRENHEVFFFYYTGNPVYPTHHNIFLYKGSPGESGKPGGIPGFGGEGGSSGEIIVMNTSDESEIFGVEKVVGDGINGEIGVGGKHGQHGKSGWDIGYMDRQWDRNWNVYGAGKDCKLRISYDSTGTDESVWCSYYKKWAHFSSESLKKYGKEQNERQTSVPSGRERQDHAKATRKKTISHSRIMADYSSRFQQGADNLLSNLRDHVDKTEQCLQAMIEKQLEEGQVNIAKDVRFQREFKLQKRSEPGGSAGVKNISKPMIRPEFVAKVNVTKLMAEFENNPKDSKFVAMFSRVELNHTQFKSVFQVLNRVRQEIAEDLKMVMLSSKSDGNSTITVGNEDGSENKNTIEREEEKALLVRVSNLRKLESLFLKKYHLFSLEEIARRIPLLNIQEVGNPIKISPSKAPKFLKEALNPDEQISHPRLGTLAQYFQRDSNEMRETVVKFITEELLKSDNIWLDSKQLDKILGTFVKDEVKSDTSNQVLKVYFQRYKAWNGKAKKIVEILLQVLNRQLNHPSNAKLLELWNKSTETPTLKPRLIREMSKDKLLSVTYEKYTAAIQESYDWEGLHHESKIYEMLKERVLEKGPLAVCYRELLAHVYETNIRLYVMGQEDDIKASVLADNHNPSGRRILHLVYKDEKFVELSLNSEHVTLENEQMRRNNKCRKLFEDVRLLKKREDLDSYLEREGYLEYGGDSCESLHPLTCGDNRVCEDSCINEIVEYFETSEQAEVKKLLGKLTSSCLGPQEILPYLLWRFSTEGCRITLELLYCFVNDILASVFEEVDQLHVFCWIIASRKQENWVDELVLWRIERYFKKVLKGRVQKWRKKMSAISNKDVLYLFRKQLIESCENPVEIQNMDQVLDMLSELSYTNELNLENMGLSEWPSVLKETFWTQKLSSVVDWSQTDRLAETCYYTLSAENLYGSSFLKKFLGILGQRKSEVSIEKIFTMLSNFHFEKWNLSNVELNMFEKSSVDQFLEKMNAKFAIFDRERNVDDLVQLVQGSQNTSETIVKELPYVKKILKNVNSSRVQKDKSENITTWALNVLKSLSANRDADSQGKSDANKTVDMLRKIDDAIFCLRGFRLRDTQKLSVIILLHNKGNTLAQVSTGEGKSLIVVTLSIMKALRGEKVDVITSSSVLAKRDADENKDIFNLFKISVSHNCHENIEDRKIAYSNNAVVYGDLSSFQRDYLLDKFYGKNVLGDRSFGNVIVDEVDSMLLDKGNNMLYLSHDLPGLDKLESVYIHIWLWINQPDSNFRIDKIKKAIINDLFDSISSKALKRLDSGLKQSQINELWDRLIKNEILDRNGRFTSGIEDSPRFMESLSPDFEQYEHRLRFLFKEVVKRERNIIVPNYLKSFVELHLDSWINSALAAFLMKDRHDYVVDIDRTGSSSDRNPNIVILDRDTGTDQGNSQWDEALHQFLQLKHGCKLSMQSLKAVFISNISYFKLYRNLYGLTGTLGSSREREMLTKFHNVDFVTIPTAKPKQFDEYPPALCSNVDAWLHKIREETLKQVEKKRSVLIICETVHDVDTIKTSFSNHNVFSYTRDYEEFVIAKGDSQLEPGSVIIATNLAGRGTDIKISQDLKNAGGLHVCLTYLPNNIRIEKQAFGRAARSGDKGSGQLIIVSPGGSESKSSKIIEIKKERDAKEIERLVETKAYYETQIKIEEDCFAKFKAKYNSLQDALSESWIPNEAKEIIGSSALDSWAFWLDRNGELIRNISKDKNKDKLEKALRDFMRKFEISNPESLSVVESFCATSLKVKDTVLFKSAKTDLQVGQVSHWAKDSPIRLVELAKYYCEQKKYTKAIALFDDIIVCEPFFSEAAHYYKAFAVAKKDGFTGSNTAPFLTELMRAERLFTARLEFTRKAGGIVEKLKSNARENLVQINAFQEQQQSLGNICNMFLQSINDIYGHPITQETLMTEIIKEELADELYKSLTKACILRSACVSDSITSEMINSIQVAYVIPTDSTSVPRIIRQKICGTLTQFLKKRSGSTITIESFEKELKSYIKLCNRVDFYNELLKAKILFDTIKYIIVDLEKWETTDTNGLSEVRLKFDKLPKQSIDPCDNSKIILNSEQVSQLKPEWPILVAKDFKKIMSSDYYDKLKKQGVFYFNESASLNREALKVGIKEFSEYDSISLDDFIEAGIVKSEATKIVEYLVSQRILQASRAQNRYKLDDVSKLSGFELPEYPIYVPLVDDLLTVHFAYRLALIKLQTQDSMPDQLTPAPLSLPFFINPYSQFIMELLSTKLLKPVTVNPQYEDLHAKIKEAITKLASEDQITYISQILEQSRSILEFVSTPDCNLVPLTDYLKEKKFANVEELRAYALNAQDKLIQIAEKKIYWKFYLNLTIVLALAAAQIAIGVLIQLKSVGLMTYVGSGFIQEGVSDMMYVAGALYSGNFSWKDYGKQKMISIAITVGTCSIGAFLSRGAKTVSTIGQTYLKPGQLLKDMSKMQITRAVGKQIAIQGGKGLAFGVTNAMADQLIQTQMQGICDTISRNIMSEVGASVDAHKISGTLERTYTILGEAKARQLIFTLINTLSTNKSFGQDWMPLTNQIANGVFQGIRDANSRFGSEGAPDKLKALSKIVTITSYVATLMKGIVSVADVRLVVNRFLDDLDKKIQKELIGKEVQGSVSGNDAQFKRFKGDMTKEIKRVVSEKARVIIDQNIVSPIIRKGIDLLSREAGRLLLHGFHNYKDTTFDKEFEEAKAAHDENLEKIQAENLSKSEKKKKILNARREHHMTLLKLFASVNVNNELRAKIMKDLKLNKESAGSALDNKTNELQERINILRNSDQLAITTRDEINAMCKDLDKADKLEQEVKDLAGKIENQKLREAVLRQIADGVGKINPPNKNRLSEAEVTQIDSISEKTKAQRALRIAVNERALELERITVPEKSHIPTLQKALDINQGAGESGQPLTDKELIPAVILNTMSLLNFKEGQGSRYEQGVTDSTVASQLTGGRLDLANNFHLAMDFVTTSEGSEARGSRWGDTEQVMSYLVTGFQKMGITEVNFFQPTADPKNLDDLRAPHAELQLLAAALQRGEPINSVQVSKPPCVCCMTVLDKHGVDYRPVKGANTNPKNWTDNIKVDKSKTYLLPSKTTSMVARIFLKPRHDRGMHQESQFNPLVPPASRTTSSSSSFVPHTRTHQELQQGLEYSRRIANNTSNIHLTEREGRTLIRVRSVPNLFSQVASSQSIDSNHRRRLSF